MDKRIVLQYTSGAYQSLCQILGTVAQMCEQLQVETAPDFVEPVQFLDHVGAASLVKVKERYILYREIMTPALSTFHPDQQ